MPDDVVVSNMSLGDRIRAAADRLHSRPKAAKAMGVSKAQLGRYIGGESEPGVGAASRLAKAAGVDIAWLIEGEGRMLVADVKQGTEASPVTLAALDADLLRDTIEALEELLAENRLELAPDKKARAIALTYELFRDEGAIDREKMARIIQLAA